MSQHDMTVDNAGAATVRVDINSGLQALASTSSGATEPATMFANQLWYDTSTSILKKRNNDNDAWISIATFDETGDLVTSMSMADITITGDITNSLIRKQPYYVENLSLLISGGTITVAGGDGTALGASNPGYICLPSNSTPGELVLYTIAANQVMTNTEMNGNLLGTTASVAWANNKPLYLYAISNDNEDSIAFAWGAIPNITVSPVSTEIGDPSSAVADEQYSLYSFDDITETSYDANNCFAIGSCTATKDASDVWTFNALAEGVTGIGLFGENIWYTYPLAVHGAATGTHVYANAGTEPAYNDPDRYRYNMKRDGICRIFTHLNGVSTPGTGTQTVQWTVPYDADSDGLGTHAGFVGNFHCLDSSTGGHGRSGEIFFENTGNRFRTWDIEGSYGGTAGDQLRNEDFDSSDDIHINMSYVVRSA